MCMSRGPEWAGLPAGEYLVREGGVGLLGAIIGGAVAGPIGALIGGVVGANAGGGYKVVQMPSGMERDAEIQDFARLPGGSTK